MSHINELDNLITDAIQDMKPEETGMPFYDCFVNAMLNDAKQKQIELMAVLNRLENVEKPHDAVV